MAFDAYIQICWRSTGRAVHELDRDYRLQVRRQPLTAALKFIYVLGLCAP